MSIFSKGSDLLSVASFESRRLAVADSHETITRESAAKIQALNAEIGAEQDRAKEAKTAAANTAERARLACSASIVAELATALQPAVASCLESPSRESATQIANAWVRAQARCLEEVGAELSRSHLLAPFLQHYMSAWPNLAHFAGHGVPHALIDLAQQLDRACQLKHAPTILAAINAVDCAVFALGSTAKNAPHPLDARRARVFGEYASQRDQVQGIAAFEKADLEASQAALRANPPRNPMSSRRDALGHVTGGLVEKTFHGDPDVDPNFQALPS
jgi:hypothetical protein